MTKQCSHCKQVLAVTEFNWKIRGVRRAVHCKKCSREYIKKHYEKNQQYYLNKAKKRNAELKQREEDYISNFLLTNPCVDCGETNILVLEFDHKDRAKKDNEVAWMRKRRLSFQKIVEEIAKCEVRCANCHRIKTAKENNSWKLKYAPVAQRIEHLSSEQGVVRSNRAWRTKQV